MESAPRFRSFFFRQRLNSVGIPFLLGILLSVSFSVLTSLVLTTFAVLCFLLFAFFLREKEARITLLCASLGLALSLLCVGFHLIKKDSLRSFEGERVTATGYVSASFEGGFDLRVQAPFRGKVRVESEEDVSLGEKGEIKLYFSRYLTRAEEREGVDLFGKAEGAWMKTGENPGYRFIGFVRQRISDSLGSGREGGFLKTILLGDRSQLSSQDQRAFRKTSSSHLLAISGLHVARMLGVFGALLRYLPLSRRVRSLLMLPILMLLLLVTGSSVSVFRAVVMAAFPLVGECFQRRSDSVTSLVFAACLLAAWEPFSVLSPSFLLSFSATFGIVAVASPLGEAFYYSISEDHLVHGKWRGPLSLLMQSFIVSSVTFVFTFPFQLLLFGTVSPLSPLYALFLIPLFSPCLIMGLASAFAALLGVFSDAVRYVAVWGCGVFLDFQTFVASGAPETMELGVWAPIPAFAVIGVLLFFMIRRTKLIAVVHLHAVMLACSLILFPFL